MPEFYIFGSLSRGEPDPGSDVDVLVISNQKKTKNEIPPNWSLYSPRRIRALFARGTLFAWHLSQEAVQLWPRGRAGYLQKIGPPKPYANAKREITDLQRILVGAATELTRGTPSEIYEFGLVALACRDIAMAAAPSLTGTFDFSRHAPLHLPAVKIPLSRTQFDYLLACRRATTRGSQIRRNPRIERQLKVKLPQLSAWSVHILNRISHE
jgi:hypothetical protein